MRNMHGMQGQPFNFYHVWKNRSHIVLDQFFNYILNNFTMLRCRLYTGIHALKPKNKSKSGAISESTTALNVDQSSASFSENAPSSAPTTALSSSVTRAFGTNLQGQNATVSDPAVGASAARKDGPMASKIPVDKKKMDARKKSLKRL
jgi:ubiquitin-conjugating enzyme E2 S